MNAIIFSKDRAMQLDCLLRSMEEFCPLFDIQVLFDYSNPVYKEGYFICMDAHPNVEFFVEQDFQEDVEMMIMPGWNCLLVDDCIFYREVDEVGLFEMQSEVDVISLRLGDEIRGHQDYHGSIDGNLFKYETLLELQYREYTNPNQLEARLVNICKDLVMGWFNEAHLKGIPANKVSSTSTCSDMGISTGILNQMFMEGKRIDYRAMNLRSSNVHKNVDILAYCK